MIARQLRCRSTAWSRLCRCRSWLLCARSSRPRADAFRRSPAASSTRPTSLGRDARSALEPKLADLEAKSGIQLVVATVGSLEGQEIEPYANALFRAWKLGEKAKNNGVLLLVAPNEHRVRIEVGYGLEGTLTDALSKVIITNAITPRFKAGDFSGGITRGVDDIITVLTTDASEWEKRPSLRLDSARRSEPANWLLVGVCHRRHASADRLAGFRSVRVQRRCWASCSVPGGLGRQRRDARRRRRRRRFFRRRRIVGRRRRIGELVMEMSPADRERIAAAIRAVEARTSGEIVCVLADSRPTAARCRSSSRPWRRWRLPWLLVAFTALAGASHPFAAARRLRGCWRFSCACRGARRADPAHGRAAPWRSGSRPSSSYTRGIARKNDRSGILIFVSLAEHYARIIADDGIAARVPQRTGRAPSTR